MIRYKLEHQDYFLDLYLLKDVHKRDGTIELGIQERIYGITLTKALEILAHKQTQDDFKDQDVSLKDYLISFYKNWNAFKDENSRT